MIASVLTVVYASKGDGTKAIFYADIAAHNATATANTLWNPRKRDFGLVQHRNARLDRKVKEAVESVTRE